MNNVLGGAGVGAVRVVDSEWWRREGDDLQMKITQSSTIYSMLNGYHY